MEVPRTLVVRNLGCPPSLNNAYTNGAGHGRRVLTSEARDYKAATYVVVRSTAYNLGFVVPPRTFLRLTFFFWFSNVQRDGSNAVKLIEDAVAEALGFNDRWVQAMTWEKAIDKRRPRCDVQIELLHARGAFEHHATAGA